MDFVQFYQHGGVFMHVITLITVVAIVTLARRMGAVRRGLRAPAPPPAWRPATGATPTLVAATVMLGVLGVAMGWVEMMKALQTVPAESWAAALVRSLDIVSYPLVWSLMCATPVLLAHAVVRHHEDRLRGRLEHHA